MAHRKHLRAAARSALLMVALMSLVAAALLVLPTMSSLAAIDDAREAAFAPGDTSPDWAALREMNGDIVAWLEVAGAEIDTPVVQPSADVAATHYLNRDLAGAWSPYGTPYLDRRCDPDLGNLLIFGHNTGVAGGMFTRLADSQANLDLLCEAVWSTPGGGEQFYTPIMALKVDYRYGPIQEFLPMGEAEMTDWLESLAEDAVSVADGWGEVAEGATRALSLVTCATPWAGCSERVIVVFVA